MLADILIIRLLQFKADEVEKEINLAITFLCNSTKATYLNANLQKSVNLTQVNIMVDLHLPFYPPTIMLYFLQLLPHRSPIAICIITLQEGCGALLIYYPTLRPSKELYIQNTQKGDLMRSPTLYNMKIHASIISKAKMIFYIYLINIILQFPSKLHQCLFNLRGNSEIYIVAQSKRESLQFFKEIESLLCIKKRQEHPDAVTQAVIKHHRIQSQEEEIYHKFLVYYLINSSMHHLLPIFRLTQNESNTNTSKPCHQTSQIPILTLPISIQHINPSLAVNPIRETLPIFFPSSVSAMYNNFQGRIQFLLYAFKSNKNQQNIQQTKQIGSLGMNSSNKQFVIIKFQPNDILLLHKPTKRAYQYFEGSPNIQADHSIVHPTLLRPIRYNNGLLYAKEKSTLETSIENRKRGYNIIHFNQEQICNTFTPVIECLTALHQNNIIHGSLSPASIIITDEDEIKLKDWLIDPKENIYYFNKNRAEMKKEDDWIALGQILLQAATLKKNSKVFFEKELTNIVQNLIDRYSRGFIFAICVLLKKNKERFPLIINYLNNQEKFLADLQLNSLYDSIKKEMDKKKAAVLATQNINIFPNMNSIKPLTLSLNDSPVKKPNTNSLTNTLRRPIKEDSENKRVLNNNNEQIKKKQIQKINKIIQRSNEFVNELMARKNNDHILKKIAPKPNIANISMYNQSIKKVVKDSPVIGSSPTKKLRAISRKK